MKLTNLAKSVLAASALTVASFSANASVIAQSSIDVTALTISIYDENGVQLLPLPNPGGFGVDNVAISFNGTSVSTTSNGNNDGDAFNHSISDPFAPLTVALNSTQTTSVADSGITGNIFNVGGANGSTSAAVSVTGTQSGDANSQIINNLEADFTFGTTVDGFAQIDFSYFLDTYVSVFDQGGEGVADWGLTISLLDDSCTGLSCTPLFDFDLTSGIAAQSGTQNQIGDLWDEELTNTVSSGLLSLTSGTTYTLNIAQSSNAAAVSVSEPASVAILGLGLLGLAGAARRRKS